MLITIEQAMMGFSFSVDSINSVKLLEEELRGLKIKRDEIRRRMNCKR